jgi:S-DNA-T family DNA segregation ATPase FtsK/SpoIIIE
MRVGIFRFFNSVLREVSFWLFAVAALALIVALATFNPADPAWTHTVEVAQLHNFGGVVGAWFADVTLYIFGYTAYLLPLGLVFAGWRLFKRGALLELDAEIVLYRVLGFAVALATAGGLAALHLRALPGAMPGDGSAGGLVGVHVGQFLTGAFGFTGGNLFMVALLLSGLTLMTGVPWVTMMDWIGQATLWVLDLVGWLVMAPLRWMMGSTSGARRQRRTADAAGEPGESDPDDAEEAVDSAYSVEEPAIETAMPRTERSTVARLMEQSRLVLTGWMEITAEKLRAWQRARRAETVAGDLSEAGEAAPPVTAYDAAELTLKPVARQSPVAGAEQRPMTGGGRHSTRIEPVFNLLSESAELPKSPMPQESVELPETPAPQPVSVAKISVEAIVDPSISDLSDLTLVPVARQWTPTSPASVDPLPSTCPSFHKAPSLLMNEGQERADSHAVDNELDVLRADKETESPVKEQQPPAAPVATMVRRLATPRPPGSFPLPPLDLLDPPPPRTTGYGSDLLDEMSRRLESLLKSFGIEVQVVAVEPGPVITRFEIEPAPGVKVNQISNLVKDLARGLSVTSVRVVEIIPGKSVIGLEIPNRKREIVYLRETLESLAYAQSTAPLTLVLGKDIGGNPVVANLNKMPHLLVAGTTGSGKSVAINAMLLSLLYKSPPSDVRLILVDPKMLELSIYEDIPHLLTPVVTDMKEAANALRWCVAEMERRYRLMAALKVRNIAGFNRKVLDALEVGEGLADPFWTPDSAQTPGEIAVLQSLPFIVVVIDELADMMMIVGKKVEELIARLAQKARAAGIHLILATQRPSVDVITGLIKANIPTRIAFQVSSRVDSRTILDQMGAEQLLGHGDMLYLPPGTGLPQRVHGAFVDDHEVNRVVDYLRQTGAPDYIDEVLAEPQGEGDSNGVDEVEGRGESDPLYDEAVRIVVESRRASVSGVQRRLRIGYNRAARLVEEMESAGLVGPVQANGSREVLAPPS